MKRRLLILMSILLVAALSLVIVACAPTKADAFDGTAEIKFVLDKEYDNFNISCPSGKIEKIDATTYVCKLDNVMPVEILVSANNRSVKSYVYDVKTLQQGNIVENITLDDVIYELQFKVEGLDAEYNETLSVVGNDSAVIEKISIGTYKIITREKIAEDILIHIGDEYIDVPVKRNSITYRFGAYGSIPQILLAEKTSSNTAFVINTSNDGMYFELIGKDDNKNYNVDSKMYNKVPIQDYHIMQNDTYFATISKDELRSSRYFDLKSLFAQKLTIKMDDRYDLIMSDRFIHAFTHTNNEEIVYSFDEIKPGEVIGVYYDDYNSGKYYTKVYFITQSDIDKGVINISKDKLISCYEEYEYANPYVKKIRFNITDEHGNKLNDIFTLHGPSSSQKIVSGEITTIPIGKIRIENNKDQYRVDLPHFLGVLSYVRMMMSASDEEVIDINIRCRREYNIKVKYVDMDTHEIVQQDNVRCHDLSYISLGCYGGYAIVGNYNYNRMLIDMSTIENNEVVINVKRQFRVNLQIENMDFYNDVTMLGNYLNFRSNDIKDATILFNNDGGANITVTTDYLDKEVEFYCADVLQYGYTKVYFVLNISSTSSADQTINITLKGLEDEWKE